jgi:4-amino-4-deoxy-L-arabinose transferase-like glycosyltransferase
MAKKKLTAWWNRQDFIKWYLWGCVILSILALLPMALANDCDDRNFDIWKIARALEKGLSKPSLLAHLEFSSHEIEPERMVAIKALIDEAYLLEGSEARGWYERNFLKCAES